MGSGLLDLSCYLPAEHSLSIQRNVLLEGLINSFTPRLFLGTTESSPNKSEVGGHGHIKTIGSRICFWAWKIIIMSAQLTFSRCWTDFRFHVSLFLVPQKARFGLLYTSQACYLVLSAESVYSYMEIALEITPISSTYWNVSRKSTIIRIILPEWFIWISFLYFSCTLFC